VRGKKPRLINRGCVALVFKFYIKKLIQLCFNELAELVVPFPVGGWNHIPQGSFFSFQVSLCAVGINQEWKRVFNVADFGFAPCAFLVAFIVAQQPAALLNNAPEQAFCGFQKLLLCHATPIFT
jgi:hypothetical protein